MKKRSTLRLLALTLILLPLSGCMRGCTSPRPPIHIVPNMDQQEKYRTQEASAFFYDGATMRPPVEGTVARGELFDDVELMTGKDASGAFIPSIPASLTVDEEFKLRGKDRYDIYCAVCHAERGDGQGAMREYLLVAARDLREQRLIDMADGEIFETITNGLGTMKGYKYPISPRDRWAIIAYVRELQAVAPPTGS